MKLLDGFEFMNFEKDFPFYGNKKMQKKDAIYSYTSTNSKRTNILLFGRVFSKRIIYKYIDRRKFIEYVNKQKGGFSLCFQRPSEWKDPYESRFYNADYSKKFGDVDFVKKGQMSLYACCFALHKDSEPSWKMYVNEKNEDDRKVCIQLRINFKALLDYLNYFINSKLGGNYMLVAGSVTYMDKGEINKLHRPDKEGNLNSCYFKDFNFTNYLRLLLIKRKAYVYEDEIRLFMVPKKGVDVSPNIVIPIPVKGCLDEKVPTKKRWGRILELISLDPDSKESELKEYIAELSSTNLGLEPEEVKISDLYQTCSRIIIGEDKESEQERKQSQMGKELISE